MTKIPALKNNNKQFVRLLVVIAIAGVSIIGFLLARPSQQALTVDPRIPAGTAEGYLLGKPDAPVQVTEFADFECPTCGVFASITEPDVRARLINTGVVAFRFFDYPLAMHKNTWTAHIAASCAADQGKFWEMHDRIFAGQDEWSGEVTRNPLKVFRKYADDLALDAKRWEACLTAKPHEGRIKANMAEGARRRISGTPTFIIGNKMLPGATIAYDEFKRYVDEARALAPASDSVRNTPPSTIP